MKKEIYEKARIRALEFYDRAHIVLTEKEMENVEVADFGLAHLAIEGLELVTYVNTDRVCAKEMVLFPGQTCPEHIHVPFKNYVGKEEVFRCRYGKIFLYIGGTPSVLPKVNPPKETAEYYTVFSEVTLSPGEQYIIKPNTKHWFQAGSEGAVVSEFSTTSYDEYDVFTNPNIRRIPTLE
jgi:D-lyxose ketol-isomerase